MPGREVRMTLLGHVRARRQQSADTHAQSGRHVLRAAGRAALGVAQCRQQPAQDRDLHGRRCAQPEHGKRTIVLPVLPAAIRAGTLAWGSK
jgi:hypothetical protein